MERVGGGGAVSSVAGRTGAVVLTAADVGAGQLPSGVLLPSGVIIPSGANISGILGTLGSKAAAGNDARLSDARTPTAHKASHATGGSDALAPADIGAAPASGIAESAVANLVFDLAAKTTPAAALAAAKAVTLDQFAPPAAPVAFNSQPATGAADPTNAQDLATKAYVDAHSGGASSAAALRWYDTKDYGAKSDLTRASNAAATAGNAVISGTQYQGTGIDAGKLIRVQAAGTLLFSGSDGAMTTGAAATNNRFTSAGSTFNQTCVGRWLVVDRSPVFMARIIGVESATQLRLATPAPATFAALNWRIAEDHYTTIATSVSGVSATLTDAPITTVASATVWFGTDDSAAIQAAVTAAESATVQGGNGNLVYHFGASAIGAPIYLQKPTQFRGAGSRGYGSVIGLGTTRLMLMKQHIQGIIGGPSTFDMGYNGAMTSGSGVLVDPEANFPTGIVGNQIIVYKAGTQTGSTDSVFLNTTVASRQSATQVTLTANAGTTITGGLIYTYGPGSGYAGGLVGPSVRNVHIVGGPGQKAGLHLINCSESIIDEVACSDFGSGVAHFIDPGPSAGFSNQVEWRSCYAVDSRIGLKHDRGTVFLLGQCFIDGNSNRVDCNIPEGMTIGIDGNAIVNSGFATVQAVGTGVKSSGRGGGCNAWGLGWAFEDVSVGFDLATAADNGGQHHMVGCMTIGSSNSGGGNLIRLRAGARARLVRGYALDADINAFGLVDPAAHLTVVGEEQVLKSGVVSDSDYFNTPFDGARGIDLATGDSYLRVNGGWRRTATTGIASRVKRLGSANSSSNVASLTITCLGSVPAGHHVLVPIIYGKNSTPTITVTDSKGNTYAVDQTADSVTGAACHAAIASGKITSPLVGGVDTITVTWSVAVGVNAFGAYEYAGLDPTTWLDQHAGATGTSTTPSSGNITTASASEVLIGVICNAGVPSFTPGSGFSTVETFGIAGGKTYSAEDETVLATGIYTAAATLGSSQEWAAVIASYKAA